MDRSRRIVDHLLADIIGNGDISHLPGAGKPLDLVDDPHTPSHQRAANKIMRDNNVAPEWITEGKALALNEASLRSEIDERAKRCKDEINNAASSKHRKNAQKRWFHYKVECRKRIERHNRAVLVYNLKTPAGIAHKPILNSDALIESAQLSAEQR